MRIIADVLQATSPLASVPNVPLNFSTWVLKSPYPGNGMARLKAKVFSVAPRFRLLKTSESGITVTMRASQAQIFERGVLRRDTKGLGISGEMDVLEESKSTTLNESY